MEVDIENLIKQAEQSEYDAKGGNKKCFLFGDYALLQGTFDEDKLKQLMEKGKEFKVRGINIARTLDYRLIDGQKGYSLQERAIGTPLHNMVHWSVKKGQEEFEIQKNAYSDRLSTLAEENQEIYDKFVHDWIAIQKSGITVDPSKPANFYYEPGKGITFIDLDNINEDAKNQPLETMCYEMASVLAGRVKYFKFANNEDIKDTADTNILKILCKFARSMERAGMSLDDVKAVISEKLDIVLDDEMVQPSNITPNAITDSTLKVNTTKNEINSTVNKIRTTQTRNIQQIQQK